MKILLAAASRRTLLEKVFGRARRHHRWWLDWAVGDRAVCVRAIAVNLRGMGGSEPSSRL
jgi:hypothetical protein